MAETIMIKVSGIRNVNRYMARLPKNVNDEVAKAGETFMRFVQKSAKLRAPRWTGQLANSILFNKVSKSMTLTVKSPYGVFQEFGFKPHFVNANTSTRSGFRIGDWMRERGISSSGILVRKHKPFITPALERGLSNLDVLLNQHVEKAVRK